jgi:hypothetical protein
MGECVMHLSDSDDIEYYYTVWRRSAGILLGWSPHETEQFLAFMRRKIDAGNGMIAHETPYYYMAPYFAINELRDLSKLAVCQSEIKDELDGLLSYDVLNDDVLCAAKRRIDHIIMKYSNP